MINGAALADLCNFLASPVPQNLTKLLSIPGLYRLMKNQPTINSFIPVMVWLANRAIIVLRQLSVETAPLLKRPDAAETQADWKSVSGTRFCCFN